MTNVLWITIATTIATLLTSWSQFWLKERAEKKRALAAAKPETNQPNPASTGIKPRSFIRRNKLIVAILMLVTNSMLVLALSLYDHSIPFNFTSAQLLLYSIISTVLVHLLLFRTR